MITCVYKLRGKINENQNQDLTKRLTLCRLTLCPRARDVSPIPSQDPTYIPRPDHYVEPLFKALKEAVQ